MFIQLFGEYLVNNNVITKDQKDSIQKEVQNARVKMGNIAITEGFLTEEQAEEINHIQAQQDSRFGDVAIEKGYLTAAQIDEIIAKQGDVAMKYFALLTDKAGISPDSIKTELEGFKKAQGMTDDELEALKKDDLDKIISLYAVTRDKNVVDLAGLVVRNMTRFITSDFYFGRMKKVESYDYSLLVGQKAVGDEHMYVGFGTAADFDGITTLAKLYAKNVTISGSDEVYDAVSEFSNLNNGLLASALSKNNVYIDMVPPQVFLNQKASGKAYILPLFVEGKEIQVVISSEKGFTPGEKAHALKVSKVDLSDGSDGKAKVLVVDDSALIRKMLIELLQINGFSVVGEATNGEEGVELYKELKPDVVTLDVTMPVMDGVEALKNIIAYDKDAKVAMITAAGQQEKLMEALKVGAKLFITKPFKAEEVVDSINNIIK